LLYSCPGYAFYLAFDANYRWHPSHFWWSLGIVHLLTWALVGLASVRLPRCWQDRPAGKRKTRWRDRWQAVVFGNPERRKALRTRLLNLNAFYWLACRAWFKPIGVWIAVAFIACWWVYMRFQMKIDWFDDTLCFSVALLLNSLFKLWIGVETVQRLAEDQKMGTLELLLSTPLRVRDILVGQWLSLRRQFLWPLVLIFTVELLLVFFAPRQSFQSDSRMRAFGIAGIILLAADLAALFWVAMAAALTSKSPNLASVGTIFRVLILPWVIFGMVAALTNLWVVTLGGYALSWRFYLGLWFVLGILADSIFGLSAWWRLRSNFRELALRRLNRQQGQERNVATS
jgi:hypothetical protein